MPQMTRNRREFFKAHPQIRKVFAEDDLRRLADSMLAMGQLVPILAWIDGVIIDGHAGGWRRRLLESKNWTPY